MNIGKYRNLQLIAEGGMSRIYKAATPVFDPWGSYNDDVIIKKLDLAKIALAPKEAEEMFEREKELLQKLDKNDSIFPHYKDYFEENGEKYLVMEYIEGENLYNLVRQNGKLGEEEVKQIGLVLLKAIGQIHQLNYLYRDMKPHNIIKDKNGQIRLIDLGIVHPMASGKNQTRVIQEDWLTMEFAAPEQFHGKADERSDFYSIGRTMQFLVTGKDYKPFEIDPLLKKIISPQLANFLIKAMAIDQKDRFQTIKAMAKALERVKIKKTKPRKQVIKPAKNQAWQIGGKILNCLKKIKIGDLDDAKRFLFSSWCLIIPSVILSLAWLFGKDYFYLGEIYSVFVWISICAFLVKQFIKEVFNNVIYFIIEILSFLGIIFCLMILTIMSQNPSHSYHCLEIFYKSPIKMNQKTEIKWKTNVQCDKVYIIAANGGKKELSVNADQKGSKHGSFEIILTKLTTLKFLIQYGGDSQNMYSELIRLTPIDSENILQDDEPLKF